MAGHRFKKGEVVTIFQMSPAKGLFIEGRATIRRLVHDVDEQYKVAFLNEPGAIYERFVDSWGQQNPEKYVREFNTKIGKVA